MSKEERKKHLKKCRLPDDDMNYVEDSRQDSEEDEETALSVDWRESGISSFRYPELADVWKQASELFSYPERVVKFPTTHGHYACYTDVHVNQVNQT